MTNDTKLQKLFTQIKQANIKKQIKIRIKTNRTDSYSLYFDIWHNGKREYEFLKYYLFPNKPFENEKTVREVIALRDKKEQELNALENDFSLSNSKKKANFIVYFESIARTKDGTWKATLQHLIRFSNGQLSFQNLNEKWIEQFQTYLVSKCKNNSVWLYMAKLKAGINQAIKDKILTFNPCSNVKTVSKQNTKREFLSLEEVTILSQTSCRWQIVKDAFLFSCYTGLRISDIYNLSWNDISTGYISIEQKKTKEPIRIPLHDVVIEILSRLDRSSNKVFYPLPAHGTVTDIIKKWQLDSGINKHITFHTARHTFATLCLSYDIDMNTISKLLGHTNITQTQVYAKLIDKKKEEAINKLPSFSGNNKA